MMVNVGNLSLMISVLCVGWIIVVMFGVAFNFYFGYRIDRLESEQERLEHIIDQVRQM